MPLAAARRMTNGSVAPTACCCAHAPSGCHVPSRADKAHLPSHLGMRNGRAERSRGLARVSSFRLHGRRLLELVNDSSLEWLQGVRANRKTM